MGISFVILWFLANSQTFSHRWSCDKLFWVESVTECTYIDILIENDILIKYYWLEMSFGTVTICVVMLVVIFRGRLRFPCDASIVGVLHNR